LTRQDIVNALTPVSGVTPHLFRPTSIAPGQAWPSMRKLERAAPRVFEQVWGIYLVLASDDMAAALAWDEKVPPVLEALYQITVVDEVLAARVTDEPSAPLCAIFVARSE